jgi:hypothetical protein
MTMANEEREFWERVSDYEIRFRREDFRGAPVSSALALRRESDDVFDDLSENAEFASDSEDAEDYVIWLQKAEEDVANRITMATATALSDEVAEVHLSFAYKILREVCGDALSRKPQA